MTSLLLVFIAFPIIAVLLRSITGKSGFTFEFYAELFNEKMLGITYQSVLLALMSSLIGTTISYILAFGIYISGEGFRRAMQKILLVTIISPPFVTSIAIISLFGRRGLISHTLLNINWNIYGWQGILLVQVLSSLSFGILLLSGSFSSIDERSVSASLDLGATPFQTVKNIIIPNTMPGFLSLFFLLFTMNFADFGTTAIIGGKFRVLATEAYNAVIATGDLSRGAAISAVMIPITILAFLFYKNAMEKMSSGLNYVSVQEKKIRLKLPILLHILVYGLMLLYILFNLLKYGTIILSTVTNNATGTLRFTLEHFGKLETVSLKAFWRSVWYSLAAGFLAVGIGTSLSYYIYRCKKKVKLLEFIASLPYIIPGTFFGLGYLIAFRKKPLSLTGTAAIVILNLAFRQVSVSNKNANALYSKMDEKLELAGKDLGANRFQLFRTVIFPMSIPIFESSFAQIFTSSMTAFGAVIFLVSPGKLVASTEMFRLIKGGGNAVGSILAILMIMIIATVNIVMTYLLKRRNEGK